MSEKKALIGNRSVRWEWENARGVWQQYPVDIQEKLSKCYDQSKTEVFLENTDRIINLSSLLENVRDEENSERRVRLTIELNGRNGFFIYEYQFDKNQWISYPIEIQLRIGKALDEDETTVQYEDREIDLKRLIEKNFSNNEKRKVHCVKSMAKLPLEVSNASNKRSFDDENEKTSKRFVSKSVPIKKSAGEDSSSFENIRTIKTKVGQIPIDSFCSTMIGKAHVYREDDDTFDAMLNQTNVGNNNNKFYLIQLIEEDQEKKFYIWLRWGRVGYNGQTNLIPYSNDLNQAKRFFCQKFLDKTCNDFYHRHEFIKYPGKYDLLQLDHNPPVEKEESFSQVESQLDERLQNLIRLICDVKMMEEELLEMKFDARKNPLGKLSSNQIKSGYEALKQIEIFIKKNQFNSAFIEANNVFYSRIPHEFGRSTPALIKTIQQLKRELELLETLDEIEIVFSKLNKSENENINPIDRKFNSLNCRIIPMSKDEKMFQLIDQYLQSTHAPTHQQYRMEIEQIFEIERQNEKENFLDRGHRMLLWHGSRLTNFAGILSEGLRIAPPEAPVTGYMFGKGIYFADMSSKSANYCYPTAKKNTGLVLLSEVSLGKIHELLHADNNADRLAEGFSSVKGLGSTAPNPKNSLILDDGLEIPMGPPESTNVNNPQGYTLNYNEYIVYDSRQVRLRYLVQLKFHFKTNE